MEQIPISSHAHRDSVTYLRPEEAARLLRISTKHLQYLRSQGRGARFKKLSHKVVLYCITDIRRWVRGEDESSEQSEATS
jgi:hypothetical protein